jgi:hypothetical protein
MQVGHQGKYVNQLAINQTVAMTLSMYLTRDGRSSCGKTAKVIKIIRRKIISVTSNTKVLNHNFYILKSSKIPLMGFSWTRQHIVLLM